MPISVSQAGTLNKAVEPAVCGMGWRWPTSRHAKCLLQSWMFNMWGPKPRAWEEVLTRARSKGGCVAWGRAQEGWMVSEFMPPQKLTPFTSIGGSVGCTAVGANAEQVAYPNINMFVCSVATWKDLSRFLWVDTAFQIFSSRADLCHQVSEHPLHVPSTSILLLAFSDQIDFPTFIIG